MLRTNGIGWGAAEAPITETPETYGSGPKACIYSVRSAVEPEFRWLIQYCWASVEEVEGKMMEILEDLIKYKSDDETTIDGEIALAG